MSTDYRFMRVWGTRVYPITDAYHHKFTPPSTGMYFWMGLHETILAANVLDPRTDKILQAGQFQHFESLSDAGKL